MEIVTECYLSACRYHDNDHNVCNFDDCVATNEEIEQYRELHQQQLEKDKSE